MLGDLTSKKKVKTSRFKSELRDKFMKMKDNLEWNIKNKEGVLNFKKDAYDTTIAWINKNKKISSMSLHCS